MKTRLIIPLALWVSCGALLAGIIPARMLFDAEKRLGDTRPKPNLTPKNDPSPDLSPLRRVASKAPGWQPNGICLCDTSGNSLPHIVSDGKSGAIISWSEAYRGWPTDTTRKLRDIYAQRVDSGGNFVWQRQGVPLCSLYATDAAYEKIVSDGHGGAIIAWEEAGRPADGYTHVWAQRLDSLGNRVWPENGVLVCSQQSGYVDICSDGHGGAIIAWVDGRNSATTSDDIYAQRIDSAGHAKWTVDGVPVCTADSIQFWPHICSNNRGGAIITWEDDYRNNATSGEDVYAQMLDSMGNFEWMFNGDSICIKPGLQRIGGELSPVPNLMGGGIIGWGDFSIIGAPDYFQSFNNVGTKQWYDTGVTLPYGYKLISDNRGGVIVFSGLVNRIDSVGNIRWGGGVSIHDTVTLGGGSNASEDYYNGIVSIWGHDNHLYAQRIDSSGNILWISTGVPVCTTMNTNNYPQVIGDIVGGLIATWYGDPLNSWNHVWVQRVYANGTPGGVTGMPNQNSEFRIKNLKIYPNPFNNAVVFSVIGGQGRIELKIYNIAGQLVKTIYQGKKGSGSYHITWCGKDGYGRDVASGVYLVVLRAGGLNQTQKIIKLK